MIWCRSVSGRRECSACYMRDDGQKRKVVDRGVDGDVESEEWSEDGQILVTEQEMNA